MTSQPREFTLRGYLEVIRRQVWLILIVAVICTAAAYGFSATQKKSYSATSSISVNDPNQGLSLTGATYFAGQTPLQEASAAVPQVTRPEVTARVEEQLGPGAVRQTPSVSVDPNSYLIHITASGDSAHLAAAIANAYASIDAALTTSEARAQYRAQAAAVAQQLHHISATSAQGVTTAATLARLQNLASVATPITVSSRASLPASPSSPKTLRNVLAALAFGLLLGIALGTARDALDRRLRHSQDVARVLDLPIVGHVRSEALGHAGAPQEASNGIGELEDQDQESFRILRQNISYLVSPDEGRTLLVTSPTAEEGKSTVAACLAVATAEAGKRTLLVECDLRSPVLAERLHIEERPGLADYLAGNAQPQQIIQPIPGIAERLNGAAPAIANRQSLDSNLVCITAGTPVPRPAELLASERFQAFLAEVSAVYDPVILDSAPLLPVADTLAIAASASTVIVCVRLDQTTQDQARAAHAALERLPGQRQVGLVLTDVRQEADGYYPGYYGAPAPTSA
jgi:capsular exopolysaccharide synthesis family protein